uniref:Uncharacterized protein n=1 Tax=Trypanosoma congolense (strain IL3000) TaxID=1068625 RepID=G0UMQ2_TRYCI|nr:hypothetical protein, unlikely [Trypanosoma congolense IL3000]
MKQIHTTPSCTLSAPPSTTPSFRWLSMKNHNTTSLHTSFPTHSLSHTHTYLHAYTYVDTVSPQLTSSLLVPSGRHHRYIQQVPHQLFPDTVHLLTKTFQYLAEQVLTDWHNRLFKGNKTVSLQTARSPYT